MDALAGQDMALQSPGKLAEVFAEINMSELPAMSPHVQELMSLAYDKRAGAGELAEVILKDYSLTKKVLQVVNSAYYALEHEVSSISRAVTILGFDAVCNMATAVAIFEDFVESGGEKEEISKLMTRSFLSGLAARNIAEGKNVCVQPEEAFICALLHRLGKIVICIYLPDMYWEIVKLIEAGKSEEEACWQVLDGLSLPQVSEEVARFWNMSEKIIAAMEFCPPKPDNNYDEMGYLRNLADFANCLIDHVCDETNAVALFNEYAGVMPLSLDESVDIVKSAAEEASGISKAVCYGLAKLHMAGRVISYGNEVKRWKVSQNRQTGAGSGGKGDGVCLDTPVAPGGSKNADDYIREISETLKGEFDRDKVMRSIIDGLYRGVGLDRVILATYPRQARKYLASRIIVGDLDPQKKIKFDLDGSNKLFVIPRSLKKKAGMAIPPNTKGVFPKELTGLVKDRMIYLLPVFLSGQATGLLYLDRKQQRHTLSPREIKTVRIFREFVGMAMGKTCINGKKNGVIQR